MHSKESKTTYILLKLKTGKHCIALVLSIT